MTAETSSTGLVSVLEESKRLGFLGPGPVEAHIEHAAAFTRALPPEQVPGVGVRFADLGAGGGVPGIPMLMARADLWAVLIDSSGKRCAFLQWAAIELDLVSRVEVWCERAEVVGHQDRARHRFDAVVARGFGPPATTIECGAPLVAADGRIVVSEPPGGRRWPVDPLAAMGLRPLPHRSPGFGSKPGSGSGPEPQSENFDGSSVGVAVFERIGPVPAELPRSAKLHKKDPLFRLG